MLANCGQARDARWPNLAPRWDQDGAKMVQDGACLAILRRHLEHFAGSWGRSLQKGPKYKNEHHYGVLATKWGLGGSWGVYLEALGGYFGRSWSQVGLTWAILASSWEPLGDMLGTRWPKMA